MLLRYYLRLHSPVYKGPHPLIDVARVSSFDIIREEGAVIARSTREARVWQLGDGTYVKQFRIKPLLSSATFRPFVSRFVKSARELARRGVPTVEIIDMHRLRHPRRDLVHYRPLEGETLRAHLAARTGEAIINSLQRFAAFTATLHERGIYFRGIHFNNIIVTPSGSFGLIDVASCEFRRRPLPVGFRARNFRPMFAYSADADAMAVLGADGWIAAYGPESTLSPAELERLRVHLNAMLTGRSGTASAS